MWKQSLQKSQSTLHAAVGQNIRNGHTGCNGHIGRNGHTGRNGKMTLLVTVRVTSPKE